MQIGPIQPVGHAPLSIEQGTAINPPVEATGAQRLVAGSVLVSPITDAGTHALAPTSSVGEGHAPIPFYSHPADANRVATALEIGRNLDVRA